MKLNQNQFEAIIRQVVTAVGMLFVTYNITGNEKVDAAVALVTAIATLGWSLNAKAEFSIVQTLARKAIQAVPAFLVTFGIADMNQATAWTALAVSVVATWDIIAKKEN